MKLISMKRKKELYYIRKEIKKCLVSIMSTHIIHCRSWFSNNVFYRKVSEMKELYYRIELPNGTILPYKFERLDQVENYMIRNDIYGYIIIM